MTTFQALVDTFLQTLAKMLPISESAIDSFLQNILHWPAGTPELLCLISCVGALVFIIFFRFDWLGMLSAFFRSVVQPWSLKSAQRSLDQHTLIFLILIVVPAALVRHFVTPLLSEVEVITSPLVNAVLTAILAFGFYFSHRWNKRINGLNHLKLFDGVLIGSLTLLSVHPAIPYIGLLWIGFALKNYHYEAIFKYSALALGCVLFQQFAHGMLAVGMKSSLDSLGHLNSVAILVVSLVTFWMTLEHLQKTLNESTYRMFQWLNTLVALFFVALYFLRDM